MDEALFRGMMEVYQPGDILFHLGDLALGRGVDVHKILDKFPWGEIQYILGNHDKKQPIYSHRKVKWCGDLKDIRLSNKYPATLCHYAMRVWNKSHHGAIQLYGHSHSDLPPFLNQLDVGVDNAYKLLGSYRPFREEEILEIIKVSSNSGTEVQDVKVYHHTRD